MSQHMACPHLWNALVAATIFKSIQSVSPAVAQTSSLNR